MNTSQSRAPWSGRKVRLIVFAWGESYVERAIKFSVAAALSPGNLPSLTEVFDVTFVFITEQRLFSYVETHPTIEKVKKLCLIELLSLDHLIGEPWQYGLSVAYSLFEGIRVTGDEMTNIFFLFLNADFVLADGSYDRLIPYLLSGHHAILAPTYCANEEAVTPIFQKYVNRNDGAISITPREMANIILSNQHNSIRAKTLNNSSVHFRYSDQFYWNINNTFLLGHQMPIALVALRPEIVVRDIETFWDWGIVYEFCPSRQLKAIGDSDEFLILELRSESTHRELLLPGATSPVNAAKSMSGYITQYQIDNVKFPLTLHSLDLSSELDDGRKLLWEQVQEILSHVSTLPSHRKHAQWTYHTNYFSYYSETKIQRNRVETLKSELNELESQWNISRYSFLDQQLSSLNKILERDRELVVGLHSENRIKRFRAKLLTLLIKLKARVFRSYPRGPLNPIWPAYRELISSIYKIASCQKPESCGLIVRTDKVQNNYRRFSDYRVVAPEIGIDVFCTLDVEPKKLDFCIVELDFIEQQFFESVLKRSTEMIPPAGILLIHIINVSQRHHPLWIPNFVARTRMLIKTESVKFLVGGGTPLSRPLTDLALRIARRATDSGGAVVLGGLFLLLSPLALLANLHDTVYAKVTSKQMRKGCALTIEIVF